MDHFQNETKMNSGYKNTFLKFVLVVDDIVHMQNQAGLTGHATLLGFMSTPGDRCLWTVLQGLVPDIVY